MLKLILGNKAYSSWSMRGWLAVKASGLDFEELVVPLYNDTWDERREGDEFAPSSGKVPLLWHDETVVWDSLAIIEYCADLTSREHYWPEDLAARAMARSMAAEMHSGFSALRRECPMNVRRNVPTPDLSDEAVADINRVLTLWAQARARHGSGGPFLFGGWSAVDMMYAPVVTRFLTWSIPVPPFARQYMSDVLRHPHVAQWIDAAQDEPWVIEQFEGGKGTA
ncbi:glutathione S-transferase [Sphingomonas astaxanthinifaciens DSM 22298]|uniref:Glutathione S-transferase n=1 Tax=Sphingomonas astaxanthinifaciens DSM 22298 TaxID=1123267 RepID=A0ABQ5ZCL2_9SPHN|nr:glutathione S-transferase family protein [Sphingomonas astaxanthinifaciens]GLR48633.1 glutathione S-transferase [Sphingomonas astaxanthinifaciens DSM 22298]